MRRVSFFAKVSDRTVLERVEFYAQDIRILEELGFKVQIATTFAEIRAADLYFVWWWTWAFLPLTIAKTLRRPIIITGVFDEWAQASRRGWHKWAISECLKRADANVFISQHEQEQIPRLYEVRYPRYVPLCVDPAIFTPNGRDRERMVLTIAWLKEGNAHRKSIPEVIRAAAIVHSRFPEVRFLIAGEKHTAFPALQDLVNELRAGSYIKFLGTISKQEKIRLLQRCAVYAQPSRFEGFGLAVLEAMSCGTPVVSSPAGAMPEVVGDSGQLVSGESPNEIATAILRYLDDDALRKETGQAARRRAETMFPYSRRKGEIAKIITEVMEPRSTIA